MSELVPSEEQTITLAQHRKILYEIRVKVGVAAMLEDQDPAWICSHLDAIVEWIDELRGES